jgi:2-polyprenyl-6-methoxyphenol hydroxylase-like FAD-dependent oxidoreductase
MNEALTLKRTPVLIAGAGPVGLALAIELAYRNICCLIVEQTDGSVDFPTTNLANTRTCEHLRRWGIADRVRFKPAFLQLPEELFVRDARTATKSRVSICRQRRSKSRSPYSPEGRLWISSHTSIRCCIIM